MRKIKSRFTTIVNVCFKKAEMLFTGTKQALSTSGSEVKKLVPLAKTLVAIILITVVVYIAVITLFSNPEFFFTIILIAAFVGPYLLRERCEVDSSGDHINPWIRWSITYPWLLILLFSIIKGLDGDLSNFSKLEESDVNSQAMVFIPIILFVLSIISIPLDKVASLTFFGFPICNLLPGPKIIPIFLFHVNRFDRNSQQEQFPGDPEKIFKGQDNEGLPPGMLRPLRITTGRPKEEDKQDPLSIQMAIEFIYFLRVQIIDPLRFQVKYGNIDEFWRMVRDTGDKVLNKEVSQIAGVAELIKGTNKLMEGLENELKLLCLEGGVEVIETGMSAPDLTRDLSVALRDIGKVRAEAEAEAGRIRKVEGANIDMTAALINQTSEALANADDSAKAAYVGEKILSDKTTVLGTDGLTQAMGLAQMLTNGIKKGDG